MAEKIGAIVSGVVGKTLARGSEKRAYELMIGRRLKVGRVDETGEFDGWYPYALLLLARRFRLPLPGLEILGGTLKQAFKIVRSTARLSASGPARCGAAGCFAGRHGFLRALGSVQLTLSGLRRQRILR
jgi:hypothetical protein